MLKPGALAAGCVLVLGVAAGSPPEGPASCPAEGGAHACAPEDGVNLLQTRQRANQTEGPPAALAEKQGLNVNLKATAAVLDQFTGASSWFWTYGLEPSTSASIEWANKNDKEFVPLVSLKNVLPKLKGKANCFFDKAQGRECTVDEIVSALEETKAKVTTKYLMGFNEPYNDEEGGKAAKHVSGTVGADWWRRFIQPAAVRAGLKLVSPTTGSATKKTSWLIEFLQACYDMRDESPPCDVTLIGTFSIHDYKCYESYWRRVYAVDGGKGVDLYEKACAGSQPPKKKGKNFYTTLRKAMKKKYGEDVATTFWYPYLESVKLWVTEHSCTGDIRYMTQCTDCPGVAPKDQCRRITGESCEHGQGSIRTILDMDNIERFSWFTLTPSPRATHKNYESIMNGAMVDWKTDEANPPGAALQTELDPAACD